MNKTEKNKIRRNARAKLYKLLKQQDNKCFYCSCKIIRLASIKQERRLKITPVAVTYVSRHGCTRKARIATVDHRTRIIDGGDNSDDNLVAACAICNLEQNRNLLNPSRLTWFCANCSSRKSKKRDKLCLKCYRELREYLRDLGNDYY